MNLIDAIKSGKRFRRHGFRDGCFGHWDAPVEIKLSRDDILATDWETEEKRVTITISDLLVALSEAFREAEGRPGLSELIERVAKNLGL